MRDCVFDHITHACAVCKKPLVSREAKRNCKGRYNVLLGDAIKTVLGFFGITEDRVSSAIGKPCGCNRRREKLNALFGVKRAKNTT